MSKAVQATFNPRNHYWTVNGNNAQVWSSAAKAYVATGDATYLAWLELGNRPSKITSEADLWDVLAAQAPDLVPNDPTAQNALKDRKVNVLDMTVFEILFNHENRIRTLAGQQAVTKAQFKTAVKGLL